MAKKKRPSRATPPPDPLEALRTLANADNPYSALRDTLDHVGSLAIQGGDGDPLARQHLHALAVASDSAGTEDAPGLLSVLACLRRRCTDDAQRVRCSPAEVDSLAATAQALILGMLAPWRPAEGPDTTPVPPPWQDTAYRLGILARAWIRAKGGRGRGPDPESARRLRAIRLALAQGANWPEAALAARCTVGAARGLIRRYGH